jgi:hypothetical protein
VRGCGFLEGMCQLVAFTVIFGTTRLCSLAACGIRSDCLGIITDWLATATVLRELDMRANWLRLEGCLTLFRALTTSNLKTLCIASNDLGGEGTYAVGACGRASSRL